MKGKKKIKKLLKEVETLKKEVESDRQSFRFFEGFEAALRWVLDLPIKKVKKRGEHIKKIVGVCKESGLPAYKAWDGYLEREAVFCKALHLDECEWEKVSKEELIKAIKKEKVLLKRLEEEEKNKDELDRLDRIPLEWCEEIDKKIEELKE